ncbi:MAG: hypothetical protein WHS86_10710 [Desulfosoma sp.]
MAIMVGLPLPLDEFFALSEVFLTHRLNQHLAYAAVKAVPKANGQFLPPISRKVSNESTVLDSSQSVIFTNGCKAVPDLFYIDVIEDIDQNFTRPEYKVQSLNARFDHIRSLARTAHHLHHLNEKAR